MKVLDLDHVGELLQDPVYAANSEPCFICGRPVKNFRTAGEVEVIWGGGYALIDREGYNEDEDAGYMGCYPIGPECKRKFDKAVKEHAETR